MPPHCLLWCTKRRRVLLINAVDCARVRARIRVPLICVLTCGLVTRLQRLLQLIHLVRDLLQRFGDQVVSMDAQDEIRRCRDAHKQLLNITTANAADAAHAAVTPLALRQSLCIACFGSALRS